MTNPFESAEFCLRRANRHSQDFNALATEFINSDAYTVTTELNAETGLKEVKVKLIRDFPEDLRGFASDAIKNIRDALDMAMAAASFVVTGKMSNRAHFPFGESADDLEDSLSRRKNYRCKGIPEILFPAIREIRPYPHEGDEFRLKLLQKVSGPHKHTVALSLSCAPPFPFAQIQLMGKGEVVATINFPEWDSSKDEIVVATFNGNQGLEMSHTFHIAFAHAEIGNLPASQVIDRWGMRTDAIIAHLKKTVSGIHAKR